MRVFCMALLFILKALGLLDLSWPFVIVIGVVAAIAEEAGREMYRRLKTLVSRL